MAVSARRIETRPSCRVPDALPLCYPHTPCLLIYALKKFLLYLKTSLTNCEIGERLDSGCSNRSPREHAFSDPPGGSAQEENEGIGRLEDAGLTGKEQEGYLREDDGGSRGDSEQEAGGETLCKTCDAGPEI